MRHLARCGPFRTALKRHGKAHALNLTNVMSHDRVENSTFAILNREKNRFVFACATSLFVRVSNRDHMKILGWTS